MRLNTPIKFGLALVAGAGLAMAQDCDLFTDCAFEDYMVPFMNGEEDMFRAWYKVDGNSITFGVHASPEDQGNGVWLAFGPNYEQTGMVGTLPFVGSTDGPLGAFSLASRAPPSIPDSTNSPRDGQFQTTSDGTRLKFTVNVKEDKDIFSAQRWVMAAGALSADKQLNYHGALKMSVPPPLRLTVNYEFEASPGQEVDDGAPEAFLGLIVEYFDFVTDSITFDDATLVKISQQYSLTFGVNSLPGASHLQISEYVHFLFERYASVMVEVLLAEAAGTPLLFLQGYVNDAPACYGYCGSWNDVYGCSCNADCVIVGDCCPGRASSCAEE